jgi:hypothetical protein
MDCKRCNKPIEGEPWYGMCLECDREYSNDLWDGGIPMGSKYAEYLHSKWNKYLDFDKKEK